MPTKKGPTRGTLLQPLAYAWFRGPATRERDVIVMDGRRAVPYEPVLEPRLGVELARVRTPDDAVMFVKRFGLLTQPRGVLKGEPCPPDLRQPFADFERAAEDLRRIFRTVLDVRQAAEGNQAALARVRQDFGPASPHADVRIETADGTVIRKARDWYPADYFTKNDRTILIEASAWAADGLSNGLVNARPYVFDPAQLFPNPATRPGGLRLGMIGESLLEFCYLTFADALANEPIARCDECNRPFVIDDKRQKFCEPACANRARFHRFKAKHATPKRPTPTHSKKSRRTSKTKGRH